jgi:hypothetical protein
MPPSRKEDRHKEFPRPGRGQLARLGSCFVSSRRLTNLTWPNKEVPRAGKLPRPVTVRFEARHDVAPTWVRRAFDAVLLGGPLSALMIPYRTGPCNPFPRRANGLACGPVTVHRPPGDWSVFRPRARQCHRDTRTENTDLSPSATRERLTGNQAHGILTRCPRCVALRRPLVRQAGRKTRNVPVDNAGHRLESRCSNDLPLIFSGVQVD